MSQFVLIYSDQGVSKQSASSLLQFFTTKNIAVKMVCGADLQQPDWISTTKLLIIPGGRSLPFYESLGALGNQHIIEYVRSGGNYLGLCAGAYYACNETIFAKGLAHEILLSGPLNFFEGAAIGPVFSADNFTYHSEQGASVVSIVLHDRKVHEVYFNGGCYFSGGVQPVRIHAHYQLNNLPAIIECMVGLGKVVLSGVHPELSYQTIPEDDNCHHLSLRKTLRTQDQSRIQLLDNLINIFK